MKSGEREVYLPGLLLLKMKTLLLKMKTKPVLSGGSSFSGHCSSSMFLWFLVCSSIFSVLPLFLFSPFFSLPCPSWLFLLPGSGSPLLSVFPRFFQSLGSVFLSVSLCLRSQRKKETLWFLFLVVAEDDESVEGLSHQHCPLVLSLPGFPLVLVSLPAVHGFLSFLPPLFLSLSLSPTPCSSVLLGLYRARRVDNGR